MLSNPNNRTIIPYSSAGAALFRTQGFLATPELFYSQDPDPVTRAFNFNHTSYAAFVAAMADGAEDAVPAFVVVGWDSGTSTILPFVQGSGVPLVGVTAAPIGPDESGSGAYPVPVFVSGYFNIDALYWDTSFTTDAQQLAAADALMFSNSRILFGKPKYSGIVTNPPT